MQQGNTRATSLLPSNIQRSPSCALCAHSKLRVIATCNTAVCQGARSRLKGCMLKREERKGWRMPPTLASEVPSQGRVLGHVDSARVLSWWVGRPFLCFVSYLCQTLLLWGRVSDKRYSVAYMHTHAHMRVHKPVHTCIQMHTHACTCTHGCTRKQLE